MNREAQQGYLLFGNKTDIGKDDQLYENLNFKTLGNNSCLRSPYFLNARFLLRHFCHYNVWQPNYLLQEMAMNKQLAAPRQRPPEGTEGSLFRMQSWRVLDTLKSFSCILTSKYISPGIFVQRHVAPQAPQIHGIILRMLVFAISFSEDLHLSNSCLPDG